MDQDLEERLSRLEANIDRIASWISRYGLAYPGSATGNAVIERLDPLEQQVQSLGKKVEKIQKFLDG
jgi:hypothetical protein